MSAKDRLKEKIRWILEDMGLLTANIFGFPVDLVGRMEAEIDRRVTELKALVYLRKLKED